MPAQLESTAGCEPALAAAVAAMTARVDVVAMVVVVDGGRRHPCRVLGRWMTSLREHLQTEGAVRARMLVMISQAVHAARAGRREKRVASEGQP